MTLMKKRMGALLLVLCMLFTMIPNVFAATSTRLELAIDSSTFTVNGVSQQIDAQGSKATIVGDYTMLPITGVVTALGGTTAWNAATRQVTIKLGDQTLVMTIDSTTAYLDGITKTMDKAPYITNDRTLVHIRALEFFEGVVCTWDATLRKVIVTYTPEASRMITLRVTNDTGTTITDLKMTTSSYEVVTDNLLTTSLADGNTVNVQVPLVDNVNTYCLNAVLGSGTSFSIYRGLNVYGVQSYVSVILGSNTKLDYAIDSVAVVQTSEMTFLNKSGITIEELYFGTSSSASTLDNGDNLLTKDVDDDEDITFDIDLSDYDSWYFLAIDEDGEEYVGKVTFADNEADEIYLKLNKADDDEFEEYDPDAADTFMVTVVNDTDIAIDGMFIVPEDDGENWKDDYIDEASSSNDDDLEGLQEEYDDLYVGEVDKNSYEVFEDIFEAETYDLVIYLDGDSKTDDPEDIDYDQFIYIEGIDLEDVESNATLYISELSTDESDWGGKWASSKCDVIVDDGDEVLMRILNDSGKANVVVTLQDQDDDGEETITEDLDDGYYLYYLVDIDGDFESTDLELIAKKGNNIEGSYDFDDIDEYHTFIVVEFDADDDEFVFDVEEMDEL